METRLLEAPALLFISLHSPPPFSSGFEIEKRGVMPPNPRGQIPAEVSWLKEILG